MYFISESTGCDVEDAALSYCFMLLGIQTSFEAFPNLN